MIIRTMKTEDFDKVHALWMHVKGFAIRSIDDSQKGVEKFLKRNPTTSIVAEEDGKVIGTILCGHDGRKGYLYHVCVDEAYRRHGIGKKMVVAAMEALRKEEINTVSLVAFKENNVGNSFWHGIGWEERKDILHYDFFLNEENIMRFNQ